MASQKISQLTAITTVASGDYFPIVEASGTTNKRVEIGVLDARYTSAASGVAAQDTANTALASGNAALTVASQALPLAGGTMSGSVIFVTQQVFPTIPANAQTTSYVLVASDAGKHISITTGGVTVPSGVFNIGEVVSIYNDSSSGQTITQGTSVTLRLAGTASTGNRTLDGYGIATLVCVGTDTFVISGAGLS